MSTKEQPIAYLLENKGWDERILAFQYTTLVTCHAVITERYAVLIDTMINVATAQVMMDHVQPYLQNGRQLLVVNTHSDWDHVWGNQLFSGVDAAYPAPIIASSTCANKFRWPEASDYLNEMQKKSPEMFGDVQLVHPTITFADKLTISGGDLTLELFPAPGHTHDQIAIYIPEIKTLFAADAAERPYPAARKPEFMAQMRQTFADLLAYEAEVVLCCHAPDVDDGVICDNAAYFDYIDQCCRDALARGVVLPDDVEAIDVASLTGCAYADAMAADSQRDSYHDYYKTTGHAEQIRAVWQQIEAEVRD